MPPACPSCNWACGSKTLSEQELFDLGQNFIRTQLATVPGAAVPLPYGGKFRQVMVDLNPEALYAKQLSATDVSNAINCKASSCPPATPSSAISITRSSSTAARACSKR